MSTCAFAQLSLQQEIPLILKLSHESPLYNEHIYKKVCSNFNAFSLFNSISKQSPHVYHVVPFKHKPMYSMAPLRAPIVSPIQASQSMSDRLTDRMEAIAKWQDTTGDTLRELGRSVQTMPQDVSVIKYYNLVAVSRLCRKK